MHANSVPAITILKPRRVTAITVILLSLRRAVSHATLPPVKVIRVRRRRADDSK